MIKNTNNGRLKHLEMIQSVIARMNSNSFMIKGWCITLVSAVFALAAKDGKSYYFLVAAFPIFAFWTMDTMFLVQERMYRKLWAKKSKERQSTETDFCMDATPYRKEIDSLCVAMSPSIACIYLPALLLTLSCYAIFDGLLVSNITKVTPIEAVGGGCTTSNHHIPLMATDKQIGLNCAKQK